MRDFTKNALKGLVLFAVVAALGTLFVLDYGGKKRAEGYAQGLEQGKLAAFGKPMPQKDIPANIELAAAGSCPTQGGYLLSYPDPRDGGRGMRIALINRSLNPGNGFMVGSSGRLFITDEPLPKPAKPTS